MAEYVKTPRPSQFPWGFVRMFRELICSVKREKNIHVGEIALVSGVNSLIQKWEHPWAPLSLRGGLVRGSGLAWLWSPMALLFTLALLHN